MNSNAWNNPAKARFATYAVLTVENPDRMAGIASTLAGGKYPFKRIKGNSVVVGGISLDTAKTMQMLGDGRRHIRARRSYHRNYLAPDDA